MTKVTRMLGAAALMLLASLVPAAAQSLSILVQSTTSTENSGLFGFILPKFKEKTGIEVKVVAVGTGQALKNAQNGDGDVVFVHAKADEEKFVAAGWGVKRQDVMYNDFVIVGPASDPAKIAGSRDAVAALRKLAESRSPFVSRGDDSGTHKVELKLWKDAAIDVNAASGSWYRETGSGMGPTLNTAVGMHGYCLTDRGTWIAFGNKADYQIAVEGDKALFNQYGVILVNPEKHAHVKVKEGQMFIDWLVGKDGQKAIADFKINGEQLFFPNAELTATLGPALPPTSLRGAERRSNPPASAAADCFAALAMTQVARRRSNPARPRGRRSPSPWRSWWRRAWPRRRQGQSLAPRRR